MGRKSSCLIRDLLLFDYESTFEAKCMLVKGKRRILNNIPLLEK